MKRAREGERERDGRDSERDRERWKQNERVPKVGTK